MLHQDDPRFLRAPRLVCARDPERADWDVYIHAQGFDTESGGGRLPPIPGYPEVIAGYVRRREDAPPGTAPFALLIAAEGWSASHMIALQEHELCCLRSIVPVLVAALAAQSRREFHQGDRLVTGERMSRQARRREARLQRRQR